MSEKSLSGIYLDKYCQFKKPVTGPDCDDISRVANGYFNETIAEYLSQKQKTSSKVDDLVLADVVANVNIDSARLAAEGVELDRFELSKIRRAFTSLSIEYVEHTCRTKVDEVVYGVVATISLSDLSPVEEDFFNRCFGAYRSLSGRDIAWDVANVRLSDGAYIELEGWVSNNYKLVQWHSLEYFLRELGYKERVLPYRMEMRRIFARIMRLDLSDYASG